MLLSPIPHVPSDESGGPKLSFRTPQSEANLTSPVFFGVIWLIISLTALYTALSTPGFWGQGIGKKKSV